jgi:hypothetical protein
MIELLDGMFRRWPAATLALLALAILFGATLLAAR